MVALMERWECELAIVGAGIIGATAAYLACRAQPEWRVVTLERSLAGQGATAYSVGLEMPYGHTAFHRELSRSSLQFYTQLAGEIPTLARRPLPLFTVTHRDHADQVTACFHDPEVRRATPADEKRLYHAYPDLRVAADEVILAGCTAGYGFPATITTQILDLLKHTSNFSLWEGTAVTNVFPEDDRFRLALADGRELSTKRVLVAAGPWLPFTVGRELAQMEQVRIKKIAALHVDQAPPAGAPVVFFVDDDAFLLPVQEQNKWLYSFRSDHWDCRPEISELSISPEDRKLALSILERHCPALVERCCGGRVFCDAYGLDRKPLHRSLPGFTGYVVAGAGSGSGFRFAPAIAQYALSSWGEFTITNQHVRGAS